MSDSLSLPSGRYHFFEVTSLSIALSSIASANSFFSLAFSSSSASSHLASETPPGRVLGLPFVESQRC